MELSLTAQLVILSVHPENGRIVIDNTSLKYSIIGAVLMDFLDNEEITISNKRLIPSFRKTGNSTHDMFAERIESYSSPRRITHWVNSFSGKSWSVFRETVNSLIDRGIIRHERRYLLKIFPYNRFFHTDLRLRTGIIDEIRSVILFGKSATKKNVMLIALINASRSHNLLVREKGERWVLRRKCIDFIKAEAMTSDIVQAIKYIQSAIDDSVTSANDSSIASNT
jgi:hypothetical protein